MILALDFQGGVENAWSNVATFVPKLAAVGGGGIRTMQRYWERTAGRAEQRGPELRDQAQASAQAATPAYASAGDGPVTEDLGTGRRLRRDR